MNEKRPHSERAVSNAMILPKPLSGKPVEARIQAALAEATVPLYAGSQTRIPVLTLTEALRTCLFHAKSVGEMIIGYEAIEIALANERHGLQKIDCQSNRVSRLLLVTNDGSPRFYRQFEFLQKREGPRVLICRLDVGSGLMGKMLGFMNHGVKTVLLNRKHSVISVLQALL